MNYILLLFLLLSTAITKLHPASWADGQLQYMSMREKIGQLFIVATVSSFNQPEEALASSLFKCPYNMEHAYIKELITNYYVGGIVFLYKSTPGMQIDCMNRFQAISKYPLLICQDCEWGLSMRLYETMQFPHNMTLGAIQDETLIYNIGKEIGRQCKAIGVHMNFAPVVDVNNNPKNPVIGDRSFGEDPYKVARCGCFFAQGLLDAGILACAKHFPGHGDTDMDSHLDLPCVSYSRARLDSLELVPFRALFAAQVPAVMSAHLLVSGLDQKNPSTLSKPLVTDLLQNELGYNGLKITDGLGMGALLKYYRPGEIELKALLAGNDILLCPLDVPQAVRLMEEAIACGLISEQEIDDRVLKILRVKEQLGLVVGQQIDKDAALQQLWSSEAKALKKELYSKAVTVVKNEQHVLPLKDGSNVKALLIGGTSRSTFVSVLQEHRVEALHVSNGQIKTDMGRLQEFIKDADIMVVGIGDMNKFVGRQFGISHETLKLLHTIQRANKKIVIVIFGNPYSLSLFENCDAIIMAYEDDIDAQEAAANVLIGLQKSCGKLPVSVEPFTVGTGLEL